MEKRTILLLAAAGSILLLYLLDATYRSYIEQPTMRLESELNAVDSKLADANTSQITARRLVNQLDLAAARALPHDPALARSSYQDWLLKLLERHQMQSASVNAESPRPVEVRSRANRRSSRLIGHRIGFSLRARTTLSRLTDFMHDFHSSGQLHKIRSFALTPLVSGNQLDLNLAIDTLALQASERRGELSNLVRSGNGFVLREEFDEFVNRNLFAKGFSKSLGQVRLNAITQNRDGELEGWFAVGAPARTQIVGEGKTLDIPLHTVRVTGFEPERVYLSVNEFACAIDLGQTLADVLGVINGSVGDTYADEIDASDVPSPSDLPVPTDAVPTAEPSDEESTDTPLPDSLTPSTDTTEPPPTDSETPSDPEPLLQATE